MDIFAGDPVVLPTILINGHAKRFHNYTVEEAVEMLLGEEKGGVPVTGCGLDGCS
jgi:hypothetical protein